MAKKTASRYLLSLPISRKPFRGLPSVPKLDAAEEWLLEARTAAWHAGRMLTVIETMALSMAGAPATVHRKLTKLKEQGVASLDETIGDQRTKAVVPPQKALAYFEQLAACLEKRRKRSSAGNGLSSALSRFSGRTRFMSIHDFHCGLSRRGFLRTAAGARTHPQSSPCTSARFRRAAKRCP